MPGETRPLSPTPCQSFAKTLPAASYSDRWFPEESGTVCEFGTAAVSDARVAKYTAQRRTVGVDCRCGLPVPLVHARTGTHTRRTKDPGFTKKTSHPHTQRKANDLSRAPQLAAPGALQRCAALGSAKYKPTTEALRWCPHPAHPWLPTPGGLWCLVKRGPSAWGSQTAAPTPLQQE